jgi:WD40 repeat protein
MKKQGSRRVAFVGEYFLKTGGKITCATLGTTCTGVFCTGDDNKCVTAWSMDSQTPLKVLSGSNSEITSLIFSKDEKLAISGSQGGTILIWDLQAQRILMSLKEHRIACTALAVPTAPGTDNLLASGSQDANVKIWDMRSGQSLYTLKGHEGAIDCVSFSPSTEWIASGDDEGSIKVHLLVKSRSGTCRAPRSSPTSASARLPSPVLPSIPKTTRWPRGPEVGPCVSGTWRTSVSSPSLP